MKVLLCFFIFASPVFCSRSQNNTNETRVLKKTGHSILVLPPYDLIANEGISPDMHKYLENVIAKDTNVVLIKFPAKKLMGVQYQNVFDKKYCGAILAKVKAYIIVMSQLEPQTLNGVMTTDRWSCKLRVYNTISGKQINSKLSFTTLTANQIEAKLFSAYAVLGDEIK